MKLVNYLCLLGFLFAGCGVEKSEKNIINTPATPGTKETSPTARNLSPSTPTLTSTVTVSPTITKLPTSTRTPYPIPESIQTRNELQEKMDEWVSGKTIFTDANRSLDEKTGKPLRLGLLSIEPLNSVYFIFYNLGFTIIETQQGVPFLINILGFEDSKGQRFTFPVHNGRLFTTDTSLYLKEFRGNRINQEEKISSEFLTPFQFAQKSLDMIGYVNVGSTTIGSDGRINEGASFMKLAEETTRAITDFLNCPDCTIENAPEGIKQYINHIPEEFDPKLPYLWVYSVSYW